MKRAVTSVQYEGTFGWNSFLLEANLLQPVHRLHLLERTAHQTAVHSVREPRRLGDRRFAVSRHALLVRVRDGRKATDVVATNGQAEGDDLLGLQI